MKRAEILEAARKCVCGDREEDYGSPENNFANIAKLWEVYLREKCVSLEAGVNICPEDVAAMMALLKIGRIMGGYKEDSFVDACGYLACAGEIATEQQLDIPDETADLAEPVAVHNDTAVEMVTMRDLVAQKFPHYVDVPYFGNVISCPCRYGFEENKPKFCHGSDSNDCNKCWSRLVPADTKIYDFMIGEQK